MEEIWHDDDDDDQSTCICGTPTENGMCDDCDRSFDWDSWEENKRRRIQEMNEY